MLFLFIHGFPKNSTAIASLKTPLVSIPFNSRLRCYSNASFNTHNMTYSFINKPHPLNGVLQQTLKDSEMSTNRSSPRSGSDASDHGRVGVTVAACWRRTGHSDQSASRTDTLSDVAPDCVTVNNRTHQRCTRSSHTSSSTVHERNNEKNANLDPPIGETA